MLPSASAEAKWLYSWHRDARGLKRVGISGDPARRGTRAQRQKRRLGTRASLPLGFCGLQLFEFGGQFLAGDDAFAKKDADQGLNRV